MLCPKCQNTMREREKGDVIIDICPACQGIWLDRGELEKLVSREETYYDDRSRRDDDDDDDDRRRRSTSYGAPPKKRKGFLGGIFEGFEGGDD